MFTDDEVMLYNSMLERLKFNDILIPCDPNYFHRPEWIDKFYKFLQYEKIIFDPFLGCCDFTYTRHKIFFRWVEEDENTYVTKYLKTSINEKNFLSETEMMQFNGDVMIYKNWR